MRFAQLSVEQSHHRATAAAAAVAEHQARHQGWRCLAFLDPRWLAVQVLRVVLQKSGFQIDEDAYLTRRYHGETRLGSYQNV